MLERQHQKEIERAVIEMLQDYDLAKYPISVGAAAEALDVKVVPYSSLDSHIRNVAFAVSSDAFTIADAEYNSATLAVNDVSGSNYNRARFSGAHELAHIFLGHSEESPFKEEEADYFVGYLLAPHPLILTLPKDAAVAERFGVSGQCASFAIDQANNRRKESSFWEPHEQWLVNNAVWRGGGLIGRA